MFVYLPYLLSVTNFTRRSINNVLSDDVTLIKYFNK